MKKVIAAKIEQILFFDSEEEADKYCDSCRLKDAEFELLDWDNTPEEEYPDGFTIRVRKSYNNNDMLVSSMTIYNDPQI